MANEVTGTVDDKDGTLIVKDSEGKDIRYTKESDLLAVKGSRDALQAKIDAADKDNGKAEAESAEKLEAAHQKTLKAEADVERLSGEIAKHTGTAAELEKLRAELETAKEAGKSTATELLELKKTSIISIYKVKPEALEGKDLDGLRTFEEVLKSITGPGGNYAIGGGGGASTLEGKSPRELAAMGYGNK